MAFAFLVTSQGDGEPDVIVHEWDDMPVVHDPLPFVPVRPRAPRPLERWERRELIQEAACDNDLRGFSLRTLIEIDYHYNEKGGDAFPSQEHIAKALGADRRAVRRAIEQLVERGYVTTKRDGRKTVYALREPLFAHHEGAYGAPVRRIVPRTGAPVRPIEADGEEQNGHTDAPDQQDPTIPAGGNGHTGGTSNGHTDAPLTRLIEPGDADSVPKPPVEDTDAVAAPPAPTPPRKVSETRSGKLIDLLRARSITVTMRPQDHKALKDSGADPERVAEAYAAVVEGEWGDTWLQTHLNVQTIVGRLGGYEAFKANPHAFRRVSNKGPRANTPTDW